MTFARLLSVQQPLHTDILIQVRPVDTLSASYETPIAPFRYGAVKQTRKPRKRYRNCSAVGEVNSKCVCSDLHVLSPRLALLNPQSTHSNSSTIPPRFSPPPSGFDRFRAWKHRRSVQA